MPSFDGSIRLSATGPLPAEHAWARFTEPRRWPSWSPQVREVDYPHPVVEAGTGGRVTGLAGVVAVFRVDAVDHAARTWSWSVRSGPVRVRLDHGVDVAGEGSTAWVVVHGLWPVALAYAPFARLALGRLVSA
ncbi:SRPBCC family protein [Phycicoccus sonneratiae]|uniref:SRPBCC family protein n=1 Tax=Phycicoccus sonneratiae TaxID=2807628 RepID=A0ABS2CH88_9MICO|nr:SRPBCC family protein [Phycicoccus sonneraticus]MBM6399233.1 SRPBCC family protein [Phycicoccus sonneraticus]